MLIQGTHGYSSNACTFVLGFVYINEIADAGGGLFESFCQLHVLHETGFIHALKCLLIVVGPRKTNPDLSTQNLAQKNNKNLFTCKSRCSLACDGCFGKISQNKILQLPVRCLQRDFCAFETCVSPLVEEDGEFSLVDWCQPF